MKAKIKVLIVDDSRAFRHGMASLLAGERFIRVAGIAKSGPEAIALARASEPDVILMADNLPGLSVVETTRRIKLAQPESRVIFVASDPAARKDAMIAGADGFVLKGSDMQPLLEALRGLSAERTPHSDAARPEPARSWLRAHVLSLTGILRLLALFLLAGIVLTRGALLSYVALVSGITFFAYAIKYYVSMGLIMLASGGNGNGSNGHANGKRFSRFFHGNGHRNGNGFNGLRNGNGHLKANGDGAKGWLKHQPFISIQLPMYNEPAVVDRLLAACAALDYENYEVLVADDSSDQTVDRLEHWAKHPKVRVSHRINRSGFKGAALRHAMEVMDPRTEFLAIFDADFVPPPQILWQFLDYFYGYGQNANDNGNGNRNGNSHGNGHGNSNSHGNGNGNLNGNGNPYLDERVAAVQGYQWHTLNADENWLTKGVRAEYSGSYVIERSGQELMGTMKMISGSVYLIRADALREVGWGTSITEDWELTLKLYLHGYKVLYTPFIQAPSECVSTFGRLVRQRMRWAEGHTYNVKKYFLRVMTSTRISSREKLEFVYYAPYYLQSLFFALGTVSWFISEAILHHSIPYWTSLLGWSLVFSNMGALGLMNLAGLFMERGVKREWTGVLSAIAFGMLLVPFQAYAALQGLLEAEEGDWYRTPKTGIVTKVINMLNLGGKLEWLQPRKRKRPSRLAASRLAQVTGLAFLLSQPGRLANALIGGLTVMALLLTSFSSLVPVAEAAPDTFYLRTATLNDGREMTRGVAGSTATELRFDPVLRTWYSSETYPTGNNDASIASGTYTFTLDYTRAAAGSTLTFTAQVGLSNPDGTGYTQFGESAPQTTANAGGFQTLVVTICSSCAAQTITAAAPKKLVFRLNPTAETGSGINLRYEGAAGSTADSRLDTPTIVVPENAAVLIPFAALLPSAMLWRMKRRRAARIQVRHDA